MTSPAVGDQATAGWADGRPPAASGSVSLTPTAANTLISTTVTFPVGRFSVPPIVITGLEASVGVDVTNGASNITTTGCTIFMFSSSTTTRLIGWIAMQSL